MRGPHTCVLAGLLAPSKHDEKTARGMQKHWHAGRGDLQRTVGRPRRPKAVGPDQGDPSDSQRLWARLRKCKEAGGARRSLWAAGLAVLADLLHAVSSILVNA